MFQKMLQGGSGGQAKLSDITQITSRTTSPEIISNAKIGNYYVVSIDRGYGTKNTYNYSFTGADVIYSKKRGQIQVYNGYYYSNEIFVIKATDTKVVANLDITDYTLSIVGIE